MQRKNLFGTHRAIGANQAVRSIIYLIFSHMGYDDETSAPVEEEVLGYDGATSEVEEDEVLAVDDTDVDEDDEDEDDELDEDDIEEEEEESVLGAGSEDNNY